MDWLCTGTNFTWLGWGKQIVFLLMLITYLRLQDIRCHGCNNKIASKVLENVWKTDRAQQRFHFGIEQQYPVLKSCVLFHVVFFLQDVWLSFSHRMTHLAPETNGHGWQCVIVRKYIHLLPLFTSAWLSRCHFFRPSLEAEKPFSFPGSVGVKFTDGTSNSVLNIT